MSGLLGGLSDLLFGKPKAPKVEWDEIAKLLKLGIDENRFDQNGLFTSNIWDEGKDAMTTTVNPIIDEGWQGLLGRINEGSPGYDGAGRFRGLLDAMQFGQQPERRPPPERKPFPQLYRPRSSYPLKYGPPDYKPEEY